MNQRLIKVNIAEEQELYNELYSAMMEHNRYDGCYIMQYSEYLNSELQMMGEFMLRDAKRSE